MFRANGVTNRAHKSPKALSKTFYLQDLVKNFEKHVYLPQFRDQRCGARKMSLDWSQTSTYRISSTYHWKIVWLEAVKFNSLQML